MAYVSKSNRRFSNAKLRLTNSALCCAVLVAIILGVISPALTAPAIAFQDETGTTDVAAADPTTSSTEVPVTEELPPEESAEPTTTSVVETTTTPSTETTTSETPGDETDVDTTIAEELPDDGSSTTVDPLTEEAPNDETPDGSVTVPGPGTYRGQDAYEPAEVLWSNVAAAEEKLAEVEAKRAETIKQIRILRVRLKELGFTKEQLGTDGAEAVEEMLTITEQITSRAVHGYMTHSQNGRSNEALFSASPGDDGGVDFGAIVAGQRQTRLNDLVLSEGNDQLIELADLKGSLDTESFEVFERLRVTAESLAIAEQAMVEYDNAASQAKIEYEAFRIGSEIFIEGAVFPIARPYSVPLIDSFGFPRMPGTADEHWHEGIDIFAPKGTPLLATERGVITRVGSGRLGGLKFWLVGESGSEWYYAHLDSFAPGLVNGMVVQAGDLVGYVGNTGNARTTPPHLHMELHPGGGRPVNPYPILKVISDVDILGIENGTFTDSPYQPYIRPDDPNADNAEEGELADEIEVSVEDQESTTTEGEPTTTFENKQTESSTTASPAESQPTATETQSSETQTSAADTTTSEQQSTTDAPACSNADTDPDGDGWGFENDTSCRVPDLP